MKPPAPKLTRNDAIFMAHRVSEQTSAGLGSTSMVLPFLFTAFSGPAMLAGLLLPLYRIASVSSSAVFAPLVLMAKRRRYFMAVGTAMVAVGLLMVAGLTGPQSAEWMLILLFFSAALLMGIGWGMHSIAENSVMANLWEVERRGSLMGTTDALSGVFLVAVALASAFLFQSKTATTPNLSLVWGAAAAAAGAAIIALLVHEGAHPAAAIKKERSRHTLWHSAKASYLSVGRQSWYRRMILARVLLVSVEYGTAFYAIHAAERHASAAGALAIFAIATAAGVVVGGTISRYVLRKSERMGLVIGGVFGCIAALGALLGEVDPQWKAVWVYTATFFALSIGAISIYSARTAYFLACVAEEDRENGLAMTKIIMEPANTTFVVVMGALAQYQQPVAPIIVIALLGIAGVFAALTLPPSRHRPPAPVAA